MSSDIAISVRKLTKTYRLFAHPGDRIKQAATFGLRKYHREFTALKDVSFDIRKGETVGIIGRNGSGKSTLLQLICGILKPTSGTVEVNGRVSALLELGAGFNPEFSGRENVYFQGALMGFTHSQMDDRFDDIAAFSDIGEFIDQPVRTYSSGMYVRLAFAVAVSVEPDIMVIDEALSVGDSAFQSRCQGRIRALQDTGAAILLVSHSHNLLAGLCDRALLLDGGAQAYLGTVNEAASRYESLCLRQPSGWQHADAVQGGSQAKRGGGRMMELLDVAVLSEGGKRRGVIAGVEDVSVWVRFRTNKDIDVPCFGISIRSPEGFVLWSATTIDVPMDVHSLRSGEIAAAKWECSLPLGVGRYIVAVGLGENAGGEYVRYEHLHDAGHIEVLPNRRHFGSGGLSVSHARVYGTQWP